MAKVVYYNPNTMGMCYDKGLHLACKLVRSHVPVDRSGKSNIFNISYQEIPKETKSLSFEDSIINDAIYFWDKSKGKPITLFWSGGLDSTGVLFALKETMPAGQKLIIRFTKHAIVEYPWLHKEMLGWKSNNVILNQVDEWQLLRNLDDKSTMLLHCNAMDCIFGASNPWLQTRSVREVEKVLYSPWRTLENWDIIWPISGDINASQDLSINNDKTKRLQVMEFLEKHVLESPSEIKTIHDLFWWLSFSIKFHFTQHSFVFNYLNDPRYHLHSDFSCGKNLQTWAMLNLNKKHKGTWLTYKYTLRNFIFKYTNDEHYRDTKTKEKSIIPLNRVNAYPHIRTKLGDDKLKLVLDDGRYWYNKDDIPDDVMNDIKLNVL